MTTSPDSPPSSQAEEPQTPGHAFVIHGRLEDLTCDAVVIPTDTGFGVRHGWATVTGVQHPAKPTGWEDHRFGAMREPSTTRAWFLDVTDDNLIAPPEHIADRLKPLLEAITDSLRNPSGSPVRQRAQHLIALPLLGTGGGGVPSAAMVSTLLTALEKSARDLCVDIAIVVPGRSRFNALQWHRRKSLSPSPDDLGHSLGLRARQGELALMIGAGVSAGAGLPNWKGLIRHVAGRAAEAEVKELLSSTAFDHLPMLDQAELVQRLLGTDARDAIVDAVTTAPAEGNDEKATPKPALSHFLLAGLRCNEVATTNYDLLYEHAVRSQSADGRGHGDIAALPYESLKPGHPWILKLHGDADNPDDIVLSRSSFVEYEGSRQAVGSLFQAMLMTRHVLFVGLSFTDDNVLRLTHHVTKVRSGEGVLGTALALDSDIARERLWKEQLTWVGMRVPDEVVGSLGDAPEATVAWQAREIEVLLDRVAMWAVAESEVLLDPEVSDADNPLGLTQAQLEAANHGRRWQKFVAGQT